MGSVRIAALAAVAAVMFTSLNAIAADYPCRPQYPGGPLPPHCACQPQYPGGPVPPHCLAPPPPPPPVIEEFNGWYIRGDIGMTNQNLLTLDNALYSTATGLRIIDQNFEAGMLFGVGVGYKWNSWLRFDVTGEYRGETGFHGMDVYTLAGDDRFNNYTAKKSEWLFLANIYADLGTWNGVTPFVGAGVGFARIGIHSFRDAGIAAGDPTLAFAESGYSWNFAWALHAGLAYEVTKNFTVELAYRYVHLGTGQSGDIIAFDGTNDIRNPMIFRDIASHDLKLGIRYMFASGYMPQPDFTPLMRRY